MLKYIVLLILFIAPCGWADAHRTGSLSQEPMRDKVMRMKRATLLVHDLERSIDFYTEILGLELYDVEQDYDPDPTAYGYPLFNIKPGARKRMALFNTSDEVRGFGIQEVLDYDWEVSQNPRVVAVLFETDDIKGLEQRLRDGGYTVYEPSQGAAYDLQFVELGFLDPDGHLLAAYQYFGD